MGVQSGGHTLPRPSDAPSSRLAAIRAELERQRSFRIEQLAGLRAEAAGSAEDAPAAEVAHAVRSAARYVLIEIQDALTRLNDGSYGTCQRCGEPIEWERLEAVPSTRLCRLCHSQPGRSGGYYRMWFASAEP